MVLMLAEIDEYLSCPSCGGDIGIISKKALLCECCGNKYPIQSNIPLFSCDGNKQTREGSQLQQLKSDLRQFWNTNRQYYEIATAASEGDTVMSNWCLAAMKNYCKGAGSILDCGCGEGTKLAQISHEQAVVVGVDVSVPALQQATKKCKDAMLIQADIEELPFKDSIFDCVYSAYTLEHTAFPERAIEEMIRVTRIGGKIMFIAPNYGSPYFPSPCSKENPGQRFRRRLKLTHKWLISSPRSLGWDMVKPMVLEANEYQIDWDTIIEPYIHTLLKFLTERKVKVLKYSSIWQGPADEKVNLHAFLAESKAHLKDGINGLMVLLGKLGLPPYRYFGPTVFVVCEKRM